MKKRPRRWIVAFAVALVGLLLVAAPALLRRYLWLKESNPVLRGRLLAEQEGCFGCHASIGSREIPNPGSRWGSVPRFAAGNALMYADGCREIGEFIRLGAPRSWLDDPQVAARLDGQHLRMPAYGERLGSAELADLTAFACALEGVTLAGGEEAAAGRALAKKHGCLACHGVEGSGGRPNPGSLGGFIPGFAGGNFPDLVRDEGEFREWVITGSSSRLAANPVIRRFWRRQAIPMPAYRDELTDNEIGELWRWVEAVRAPRASPTAPPGE